MCRWGVAADWARFCSSKIVLVVIAALLGVLTAFMVWSVQWVFDARRDLTFDVAGAVSVLNFMDGPDAGRGGAVHHDQQELRVFLYSNALTLVISPLGDGQPQIVVFDVRGKAPWFPQVDPSVYEAQRDVVYLFRGSFSEQSWLQSGTVPYLPGDVDIRGIIDPPEGVSVLQYARPLQDRRLAPGQYTLSTSDPALLQNLTDIVSRQGLRLQSSLEVPLMGYLLHNPLFIITTFFLALGYLCAVLYWIVHLTIRGREFGIRARHGADARALVVENFFGGAPALVIGGVVGVVLSALLVSTVGHVSLEPGQLQILAGAALLGAVLTTTAWIATLTLVIHLRYGANLAE